MVTSRFPTPVIGGDRIRIVQMMEALNAIGELHVVSLVETLPDDSAVTEAKSLAHTVTCIHQPRWKSYINTILGFLTGRSLQQSYYTSFRLRKLIKNSTDFDVIYCSLIRTAHLGLHFSGFKVLDMCDLISYNYQNAGHKSHSAFWRLLFRIESSRVNSAELDSLELFDKILFINSKEMEGLPHQEKLLWVPNTVHSNCMRDPLQNYQGSNLVFIGKMDYQPNIDAVTWFLNNILPNLRSDVTFHIIGPNLPEKLISRILGNLRIIYHGYLPDPIPIIQHSLALVAPMQTGGGVQNKILEGMALGVPVITTPLAASGLQGAINGENILICQDYNEWVEVIHSLLNSTIDRNQIGLNGRTLILKQYSKTKVMEKIQQLFE